MQQVWRASTSKYRRMMSRWDRRGHAGLRSKSFRLGRSFPLRRRPISHSSHSLLTRPPLKLPSRTLLLVRGHSSFTFTGRLRRSRFERERRRLMGRLVQRISQMVKSSEMWLQKSQGIHGLVRLSIPNPRRRRGNASNNRQIPRVLTAIMEYQFPRRSHIIR